jgi:Lrp/AsnC family transcriptional regulator, leucine-responsive regulatory protein
MVAPPPGPAAIRPTPASDTAKPAHATGCATRWCQQAAMIATSTGVAPTSSAAWLTLVRAMPVFCTMIVPPYPTAPQASTAGVQAARTRERAPAPASRTAAARPKRAKVSQAGASHSSASRDAGTVVPHSRPAAVRAAKAGRRLVFIEPSCCRRAQNLLFRHLGKLIFRYMAIELDEVDVQLLTALQADADRTNVELARMVGLSPAATLHRVRWLKESGVIRVISARLDPAAAGFPLQMYVTASLSRHDPRSTRIFEDQVRALPQIITADNVAGETDYLLTVVARDVTELQQVLAALATRGGHRLVTYLRLEEIKPPSRLPLTPTTPAAGRPARKRRRAAGR